MKMLNGVKFDPNKKTQKLIHDLVQLIITVMQTKHYVQPFLFKLFDKITLKKQLDIVF